MMVRRWRLLPYREIYHIWKIKLALKSSCCCPRVFRFRPAGTPHGNLREGTARQPGTTLLGTGPFENRTDVIMVEKSGLRRRFGRMDDTKRSESEEGDGGHRGTKKRTVTPPRLLKCSTRNASHQCGVEGGPHAVTARHF